MKVASISDIHIDEHSRFEETCRILEWVADDIGIQSPDLITIAGDSLPVSVRPSTPRERGVFKSLLRRLSGLAPVVVITGNHDIAAGDIMLFSDPERGIYVYDSPQVFELAGAVVGVLPWASKGFLMSRLPEGTSKDSVDEACRAAMNSILRLFTVKFSESPFPRVLVGHLNVTGSDAGGFALVGQDVEVSAEALEATGADFVHLGHIHKHQLMGDKGVIAYSGSPRRVDHGEESEVKGYLSAIVSRGQLPVIQFIETPLTPMQTIEIDAADPFTTAGKAVIHGAEVRLIINVNEEDRQGFDLERIKGILGAENASVFKHEFRTIPTQRVRAPEMRTATSDAEKLKAYLGTLEQSPDAETTARLLLKLESLQVV